ncbi:MAG: metallophosphoesterase family protein [Planctomycetota bacterium]
MSAPSGRIVILSDTHLANPGRGAGSAKALRTLWEGASEVIFNGDVAEIADEKLRGPAARQVVELLDLAEADGVKLTFISGNHDPLLTDRRYLRLANREVFLTHGDILHPAISPWTDHAKHLQALHADAVLSLDPDKARDIDHQLAACQHASVVQWDHFVTKPHGHEDANALRRGLERFGIGRKLNRRSSQGVKMAKALYYWHTIPRRAMGFARRFAPESRFFIFGHIHRAGIWHDDKPLTIGNDVVVPDGGRYIINTGAYQTPRNPRAVVIDGCELSVWPVKYNLQGHRFGEKPLAQYTLKTPAVAAQHEAADDAPPRIAA